MPTLAVEGPNGLRVVRVTTASRLVDVCDEHEVAVPFSCRSARCGTCLISVLDGAEWLDLPGEEEATLLATGGLSAGHRFACAVHVKESDGWVHLRIEAVTQGDRKARA